MIKVIASVVRPFRLKLETMQHQQMTIQLSVNDMNLDA